MAKKKAPEVCSIENCVLHSGLEEKIQNLASDAAEIKADVKALITANAKESGFRALGRAFAVGAGVATPLTALAWALWKGVSNG
ncbi:hypothetical protein EPN96_06650 [bacterium]|nr:MAG: hypothetical protein EPN96_06650 [bacterium]